MGETTIGWTNKTWNPLRGCSKISPGCAHCYAAHMAARFSGRGQPYEGLAAKGAHGGDWIGHVRLVPHLLEQPLHWTKPCRIFVNSMSDLYHESVPDDWIASIWSVMEAARQRQHVFQILTKRAARQCAWVRGYQSWMEYAGVRGTFTERLAHVHLGVSAENQRMANERIPWLLQTPAAVRFLSVEPLLGPIDLRGTGPHHWPLGPMKHQTIHWVIVGGESGPHRRPMRLEWLESIVEQCQSAGVPVFVKQDSALRPGQQGRIPDKLWQLKEFPAVRIPV